MKKLVIKDIKDFNLDHIFDCGQCFRWNKEEDGSYTGVAFGNVANVNYSSGDVIIISPFVAESAWRSYLDLERDYGRIKEALSSDNIMKEAIAVSQGIRILNQDKWETLISFIISQNNNITRIKGCVEMLCRSFGRSLGKFGGREFFDFPGVDRLSKIGLAELDVCRLGYRAKYIAETARLVERDGGTKLSLGGSEPIERAREYLLGLPGVGPKVADCIMLFSMNKAEAFPIDVWVARVMSELYGFDEEDYEGMQKFAAERFAPYGGIAQQYLFHYIRHRGALS